MCEDVTSCNPHVRSFWGRCSSNCRLHLWLERVHCCWCFNYSFVITRIQQNLNQLPWLLHLGHVVAVECYSTPQKNSQNSTRTAIVRILLWCNTWPHPKFGYNRMVAIQHKMTWKETSMLQWWVEEKIPVTCRTECVSSSLCILYTIISAGQNFV